MRENYILFFTATIKDWHLLLKTDKYKQIVLDSLKFLVEKQKIWLYGFVIMPNHIHVIWKIREPYFLQEIQRNFLKFTSQMIKFDLEKNHPQILKYFEINRKDRKHQFWQDRSYSNTLETRKIVEQKIDYIHFNPLSKKWKLVEKPDDYYFSTAKYYHLNIDDWGFLTNYTEHI